MVRSRYVPHRRKPIDEVAASLELDPLMSHRIAKAMRERESRA